MAVASRRRFFVSVGVSRPGAPFRPLPAVATDLARTAGLFSARGYLPGPQLSNPSATDIRESLGDWLRQTNLQSTDTLVLYYSGHGLVSDGDHYMVTAGFDPAQTGSSGLKSSELIELICRRTARPGKLWLILDCCQAGGALTEGLCRKLAGEQMGIFLLAASNSWGQAADGGFSLALERVLSEESGCTGVAGRGPSLDQVVERMNEVDSTAQVVQAAISSSRFDLLDALPGCPKPAMPLHAAGSAREAARAPLPNSVSWVGLAISVMACLLAAGGRKARRAQAGPEI